MRYAIIAAVATCYFLGWLPASLAVPLLLVMSLPPVRRLDGPTRQRGGYVHPPAPVSSTANQTTAERVATYTSSPVNRGDWPEVRTALTKPPAPSRITAPGFSGNGTAGSPGHPGTAAEHKWLASAIDGQAAMIRHFETPLPWPDDQPADCGCGDTAA